MEFFSASQARAVRPLPMLIPLCDKCKLFQTCESPRMKPTGEGKRGFLILGEYPTKEDDFNGQQWSGRMGSWLEFRLRRVGINMRRDCWLDNASRCLGAHNHKTSVTDCRPNITRFIEQNNPIAILLLGYDAVKSVIGHAWKDDVGSTVGRWVGYRIPCQRPNSWLIPMNSPAYLIREEHPVLDMQFDESLEFLSTIRERPWPNGPPDYESQVECIFDPEEAAQRIRKYRDGVIAFDFEASMLKPDSREFDLVCCSVCWNGTETIAFPWVGVAKEAMVELLEDGGVGKIAANAKYEDRVCRSKGILVRGWVWDTMLAAHALDSRSGVTGLKFQAFCQMGMRDYNHHIEPFLASDRKGGNEKNRVREIDLNQLLTYCALDSRLEWELSQIQMQRMGEGSCPKNSHQNGNTGNPTRK